MARAERTKREQLTELTLDGPAPGPNDARNARERERRAARKGDKAPRSHQKKTGTDADVQSAIVGLAAQVSIVFGLTVCADCGTLLAARAEMLAGAWLPVARRSPFARRAILRLGATSDIGTALAATAATIGPVLAHHGVISPKVAALFGGATVGNHANGAAHEPVDSPPVEPTLN